MMGAPLQNPSQAEQDFAKAFALAAPASQEAKAAFERFSAAGLPSRRVESWHYTDLRGKLRAAPPPAKAPDAKGIAVAKSRIPATDTLKIVTIDGYFVPELSSDLSGIAGVTLTASHADSFDTDRQAGASDPLLDLNAVFAPCVLALAIAAGATIEKPLEILALPGADPSCGRFGRVVVSLQPGARASVIETRAEGAEGFSDSSTSLMLGADARLDYACRCETSAPVEVQNIVAWLDAGAQLRATALIAAAPFLRRQMFVACAGENAQAHLSGATLLKGREHADTTLTVTHEAPACLSRETFKYVLAEQANGVFQGKIVVPSVAQKTDGKMLCRGLLLSDDAAMSVKPELEIFADDVACGHGASCAKLDANQLFYMESRGMPRHQAQAILIEAFAAEAFDILQDEAMRDILNADLSRLLATGDFA
jgi:Fe-S cluster assembly protein SufD